MSHFSKNTKVFVTDKEAFIKACRSLGITGKVKEGGTIRSMDGQHKCALAIELPGQYNRYDVGLVEEGEGRYSVAGDFYCVRNSVGGVLNGSDSDIQNKILQKTAEETIKSKYEAQGFDVTAVEDHKTGAIQMTLTRAEGGRWG